MIDCSLINLVSKQVKGGQKKGTRGERRGGVIFGGEMTDFDYSVSVPLLFVYS